VTDTYSYDAFGNLINSTGTTKNNYLFAGEEKDNTTGYYYLRARYMDTTTGRFTSMDSYLGSVDDPVSLHKYLYANANPVNYIDPSGYFSLAELMEVVKTQGVLSRITYLNVNNIFYI
ncbi:MAG: RHS repeat-associated core domain-containing protein, partial [Clostridium sp.]|nr:RHS repeat-associated core domain-containing protein [Clostridium sp.]